MRKMKWDNEAVWIEFLSTPKERNKKLQAKWPTSKFEKWCECVLHVEYRKYRKTEAWPSLGMQFVSHVSCLWWDGVCNICKFHTAWTSIKEALWGRALVASQQNYIRLTRKFLWNFWFWFQMMYFQISFRYNIFILYIILKSVFHSI